MYHISAILATDMCFVIFAVYDIVELKNAFSHKNKFNIFKIYGTWGENDDHLET